MGARMRLETALGRLTSGRLCAAPLPSAFSHLDLPACRGSLSWSQIFQGMFEFIHAEGLAQQCDEGMGRHQVKGSLIGSSRHKKDGHLRIQGAKAWQGSSSTQARHVHVEHHDIRWLKPEGA